MDGDKLYSVWQIQDDGFDTLVAKNLSWEEADALAESNSNYYIMPQTNTYAG